MTSEAELGQRQYDDAPATTSKTTRPDRALFAEAVTINRPAQELYDFWRDPTNLIQVMDNILSIQRIGSTRSRWTVKAPAGRTVSWEAVITEDVPGARITWQSAEGADVVNSGRFELQDAGDRGTVVRAAIADDPPGGAMGKLIAELFQRELRLQSRRDLQATHGRRRDRHGVADTQTTRRGNQLMRALTWHGKHDVLVDTVDDPEILNPRDAIIKITSTAICGSDLQLYDGYIPTMKAGTATISGVADEPLSAAAAAEFRAYGVG